MLHLWVFVWPWWGFLGHVFMLYWRWSRIGYNRSLAYRNILRRVQVTGEWFQSSGVAMTSYNFPSPALLILLLCISLFKSFHCLSEEHKGGLVGVRKLATAVDCSGVVAFSGTGTREVLKSGVLSYLTAITDRGVGWSLETGEFTIHCPGLYQLAFAGYGSEPDTRFVR